MRWRRTSSSKPSALRTRAADQPRSPLLARSRQLEYTAGALLYRDISFGSAYFVGQDTVWQHSIPLWSMSCAGGAEPSLAPGEVQELYAFLRVPCGSLRALPFRGPPLVRDGLYACQNDSCGDLAALDGRERVERRGDSGYALRCSGGQLRERGGRRWPQT